MPTYDGEDIRRRLPSVPRKVSGISQSDVRVSFIGTVIDVSENAIVLYDGTGKINISVEGRQDLKRGQLVRAMGRIMPSEGGAEMQGETVQDMAGLDLALRKRAETPLKRI